MDNLKEQYNKIIIPYFLDNGLSLNRMAVPMLVKVSLNIGFNSSKVIKDHFELYRRNLTLIAGQYSVFTRSRKSISNFKLRENDIVGCKVTLRRFNMYNFLERLLFVVIPRIRDFRGLNKNSFDSNGNFSIGIKDQTIFPEVDYEKVEFPIGLDITFVTNARKNTDSVKLFELFNFPFKK